MTPVTQCDPRDTQSDPWATQSDPRVTQSDPRVTQSDPKVTQSDPRVSSEVWAIDLWSCFTKYLIFLKRRTKSFKNLAKFLNSFQTWTSLYFSRPQRALIWNFGFQWHFLIVSARRGGGKRGAVNIYLVESGHRVKLFMDNSLPRNCLENTKNWNVALNCTRHDVLLKLINIYHLGYGNIF